MSDPIVMFAYAWTVLYLSYVIGGRVLWKMCHPPKPVYSQAATESLEHECLTERPVDAWGHLDSCVDCSEVRKALAKAESAVRVRRLTDEENRARHQRKLDQMERQIKREASRQYNLTAEQITTDKITAESVILTPDEPKPESHLHAYGYCATTGHRSSECDFHTPAERLN